MKKNIQLITWVLVGVLLFAGCGKEKVTNPTVQAHVTETVVQETETTPVTDEDYYMLATSQPASVVEEFAMAVRNDILLGDWESLSQKIAYPITIKETTVTNEEGFLHLGIDSQLSMEFVEAIEEESCRQMFCNWQGVSMGNAGQIWLGSVAGEMKVIALNGMLQTDAISADAAMAAYAAFLSGDRSLLEEAQWWVPDFSDESMAYEYTYLDLDGDGVAELLIQMADDPSGYNGVFHFADGKLLCWNSDTTELSSRDYPLMDGTMVRLDERNGTRSYSIFRYQAGGEREEISRLFAREERIPEDSTEPCPYYEIDGTEVEKAKFEEQVAALVTDRMLTGSFWTII